jgi:uncharacterized protein YyaL (SSP411 family)
MYDSDKRLRHRYRDGEARIAGFLDDYVFLVWGLLELFETVFDAEYLKKAIELTESTMEHFWDPLQGGFFLAADDSDVILLRSKETFDGAVPSGNSVAALNLIRLAHITGNIQFEQNASQLLRSFSGAVSRFPSAFAHLMTALDFAIGPSCEVIIVGESERDDTQSMLRALRSRFLPRKVVLQLSPSEKYEGIKHLSEFMEGLTGKENEAKAYICCNRVCSPPATDPNKMLEQVDQPTL